MGMYCSQISKSVCKGCEISCEQLPLCMPEFPFLSFVSLSWLTGLFTFLLLWVIFIVMSGVL